MGLKLKNLDPKLRDRVREQMRQEDVGHFTAPTPAQVLFKLAQTSDESKLNKTERARLNYLRALRLPWLCVQAFTLKLADDCRLTPDFCYITNEGLLVLEDVKGFQREDALIKMKVAARKFTLFKFVIVFKEKSGWREEWVKP